MSDANAATVLSQGAGYGVVVGIGLFFLVFMPVGLTWIQARYAPLSLTNTGESSSIFHSVKIGLIVCVIVWAWRWAAALVRSSAVAYKYGISSPFSSGLGTSTPTNTPSPSSSSSNGISTPTAAIIGSVVGALVLLGLIGQAVRTIRKKRQRVIKMPVAAHSQVPTYAPTSTQSQVPTYTPVSTQLPSSPPPASAPVTTSPTPNPQPHNASTAEEVNRLRQEMDAMMAAMYEQQQQQQSVPVHGEDGGYVPPPEYQLTAPSQPSGAWQPPRAPPHNKSRR